MVVMWAISGGKPVQLSGLILVSGLVLTGSLQLNMVENSTFTDKMSTADEKVSIPTITKI